MSKRRQLSTRPTFGCARLLLFAAMTLAATQAFGATYTVANLDDSGAASLRQAILDANANGGPDTIEFGVAGTINILTPLPALDGGGTTIDGTSAPDYNAVTGVPVVVLQPVLPCATSHRAIRITSAGNTVKALQIVSFNTAGTNPDTWAIYIEGPNASGNVVRGCYIGTDGEVALKNYGGVCVFGAGGNRIGPGNVVSGNHYGVYIYAGTGNMIAGNHIGTNATGSSAVPNLTGLVTMGNTTGTLIGTDADGTADEAERNVISGNTENGIWLGANGFSYNDVVAGNYIGTDATGSYRVDNRLRGVYVQRGAYERIGTNGDGVRDAVERNVVSGNVGEGILIAGWEGGGSNTIAGNYIGTDCSGTEPVQNNIGVSVEQSNADTIGCNGDGSSGDEAERNVISGNNHAGVKISGGSGTVVAGNYVGVDCTGMNALDRQSHGVYVLAPDCRVGTNGDGLSDSLERNVISGNAGAGITVQSCERAVVAGNYIGTDAGGTGALGNDADGVRLSDNAHSCLIGGSAPTARNTIAFNNGSGVLVRSATLVASPVANAIRLNSIHSNGKLGINLGVDAVQANDPGDADIGPNLLQNFPLTTNATMNGGSWVVSGTLNSTPDMAFSVDVYGNTAADPTGYGEGEVYLGSGTCTTDGTGNGTWSVVASRSPVGLALSATATDPAGNTSEFGRKLEITGNTPAGSPVTVSLAGDTVKITFTTVTQGGDTTCNVSGTGQPPPSGFKLGNPHQFFEITTTASYRDKITISIAYSAIPFGNEESLELWHWPSSGGPWVRITTWVDTANKIIHGEFYSFSAFAIFEPAEAPTGITFPAALDPVQVDTQVNLSATFLDPDEGDSHTAQWNWGDGETSLGTVVEPAADAPGSVAGSHTYSAPGVYTVALTITDAYELSAEAQFQYVVVYDPDGGFVTGGGWITSPEGAYAPDPALTGKATFGFNSKYKKGATIPTGETEFQFKVASLNFHSSAYEWLVVAGAKAKYKGTGTINNAGDYGFMLTAIDGQISGGGGTDKFRIKIWDRTTDAVVYDNKMGASEDSGDATDLGGGSIVIHSGGVGSAAVTAITGATAAQTGAGAQVVFTLTTEAKVTVEVLNIAGRSVARVCADRATPAGASTLVWNARSASGTKVPAGRYLVRVTARSDDGQQAQSIAPMAIRR